jgi:hypothetical protein
VAGHPVSAGGNGEPVRALSAPAALTVRRAGEAGAERRQQLKWLMSGSVVTVLGLAGIFGFGFSSNPVVLALDVVSFFATFALPAAISVAILRYRRYEIDRIISRTVRDDLARVVNGALEPAHVWVWTSSGPNR